MMVRNNKKGGGWARGERWGRAEGCPRVQTRGLPESSPHTRATRGARLCSELAQRGRRQPPARLSAQRQRQNNHLVLMVLMVIVVLRIVSAHGGGRASEASMPRPRGRGHPTPKQMAHGASAKPERAEQATRARESIAPPREIGPRGGSDANAHKQARTDIYHNFNIMGERSEAA